MRRSSTSISNLTGTREDARVGDHGTAGNLTDALVSVPSQVSDTGSGGRSLATHRAASHQRAHNLALRPRIVHQLAAGTWRNADPRVMPDSNRCGHGRESQTHSVGARVITQTRAHRTSIRPGCSCRKSSPLIGAVS